MTLLEMLDVLEAGCTALQQRTNELAAALSQAGTDVTSVVAEAPKRRPAKRKRKPAKGRAKAKAKTAKKPQLTLPIAATDGTAAAAGGAAQSEEGPKVGKRQALGMSFSKLRAAIQSRRNVRRGDEEPNPQ